MSALFAALLHWTQPAHIVGILLLGYAVRLINDGMRHAARWHFDFAEFQSGRFSLHRDKRDVAWAVFYFSFAGSVACLGIPLVLAP